MNFSKLEATPKLTLQKCDSIVDTPSVATPIKRTRLYQSFQNKAKNNNATTTSFFNNKLHVQNNSNLRNNWYTDSTSKFVSSFEGNSRSSFSNGSRNKI